MTKCSFKKASSGKLICTKHNQALIYVYPVAMGYNFVCQIGEDESKDELRGVEDVS